MFLVFEMMIYSYNIDHFREVPVWVKYAWVLQSMFLVKIWSLLKNVDWHIWHGTFGENVNFGNNMDAFGYVPFYVKYNGFKNTTRLLHVIGLVLEIMTFSWNMGHFLKVGFWL